MSGAKNSFALAFESVSGSYELRNAYFQGVHGSKDISIIHPEGASGDQISVFEGFMDFLSAIVLSGRPPLHPVIVMNSVAMKDRTIAAIRELGARQVDLYLDRDEAGTKLTRELQESLADCIVTDRSGLYAGHKDMNEWLMTKNKAMAESPAKERC
ncbi:MAG: toprim domain-containing protein [Caldilineaceae bacterium]